jgi:predicted nucleic acid binding AN1-type Zn finger protein
MTWADVCVIYSIFFILNVDNSDVVESDKLEKWIEEKEIKTPKQYRN